MSRVATACSTAPSRTARMRASTMRSVQPAAGSTVVSPVRAERMGQAREAHKSASRSRSSGRSSTSTTRCTRRLKGSLPATAAETGVAEASEGVIGADAEVDDVVMGKISGSLRPLTAPSRDGSGEATEVAAKCSHGLSERLGIRTHGRSPPRSLSRAAARRVVPDGQATPTVARTVDAIVADPTTRVSS